MTNEDTAHTKFIGNEEFRLKLVFSSVHFAVNN
jgi:hypothetical protein